MNRRTALILTLLVLAATVWLAVPDGVDDPGMSPGGEPGAMPGEAQPGQAQAEEAGAAALAGEETDLELAAAEAGEIDSLTALEPAPRIGENLAAPGTRFEPGAYDLTTIEIFRGFWRNALAWTAEDFYDATQRMEGLDGRETYQVYVYLRTCLDQPRSQQQFDRFLARAERSRRRSEDRLQRLIEDRAEGLIRCEGLKEDDLPLLAYQWLDLAAQRGYPQAQVAYYRSARWLLGRSRDSVFRYPDLVLEYRDRAPGYLASALASGHPDALLEYSDALRDGILFPADSAQAYAYAVAADLAAHGGHDEARRKMDELAEVLEPGELGDAREQGRELCRRFCRADG